MALITKTKSAPAVTEAPRVTISHHTDHEADYTPLLDWFAKQGAHFVRVASPTAKVNAPGKQPLEANWQKNPSP